MLSALNRSNHPVSLCQVVSAIFAAIGRLTAGIVHKADQAPYASGPDASERVRHAVHVRDVIDQLYHA